MTNDPREFYLTAPERAELLSTLDELADARAAYARHKRTALTGADVNPAGDMGGIRGWSRKKKEQMWNRVFKDARRSLLLYKTVEGLEQQIPFILSGDWMRNSIRQHAAIAERAERKRRSIEAMAARDARRQEQARKREATRKADVADLSAYNMIAQFVYDFCEARQRELVGRPKRWAEMTLADHYHNGAREPWIAVQAAIAAAHLRGPGSRATTAMILRDLDRARASAIRYQAAHPAEPHIAARTWGHLATDAKVRALFATGALGFPAD